MINETSSSSASAQRVSTRRGLLALSPIAVFLTLYVAVSVIIGDFYAMPLSIAFVVAAMWSLATLPRMPMKERIEIFSNGAANTNILYMIWIFVLAGAFSALAKGVGAIDATVELTLSFLPARLLLPGLFVTACFISMSIGTSVGTIVALTPFACQVAQTTGVDTALLVSVVLGGSFFGDNLSFISDTTIAATRSLRVQMNDKFKANLRIVLPAALVVLVLYFFHSTDIAADAITTDNGTSRLLVLPYLLVIAAAIAGMNVLLVLTLGIAACMVLALCFGGTGLMAMCGLMGDGIKGMSDLIVVTLLAAGLLEVINYNGGIRYLIQLLTKRIGGSRGAQASIALLVSVVNVCTANNTIAIITTGSIARNIGQRYDIDPRKTASLLDTCSCIVQCIIPYGAQTLLAAGLAGQAPVAFLPYHYYAWALAIMVAVSIVVKRR
ncbi:MAG: Na+/H+ antiporter NhaC family protein [Muribaculaceae bacterium]|nr:Na+/H+ antiporter NhaC family protein [Muribaculaceae bacterium]